MSTTSLSEFVKALKNKEQSAIDLVTEALDNASLVVPLDSKQYVQTEAKSYTELVCSYNVFYTLAQVKYKTKNGGDHTSGELTIHGVFMPITCQPVQETLELINEIANEIRIRHNFESIRRVNPLGDKE